ncbi:hypothetical protein CDAR_436481 [Caerostris darwini]|uniref:Uncharacterized protein n=1 Tax=Caerostris darwini TaxID=1538125 RepID=A0AAV4R3M7_9ARAC|nr:hypothetical protein CDAR_436481 [Caerostris darwini]
MPLFYHQFSLSSKSQIYNMTSLFGMIVSIKSYMYMRFSLFNVLELLEFFHSSQICRLLTRCSDLFFEEVDQLNSDWENIRYVMNKKDSKLLIRSSEDAEEKLRITKLGEIYQTYLKDNYTPSLNLRLLDFSCNLDFRRYWRQWLRSTNSEFQSAYYNDLSAYYKGAYSINN